MYSTYCAAAYESFGWAACPTNIQAPTHNYAADEDQAEKAEARNEFMKTAHSQIEENKNYVYASTRMKRRETLFASWLG